MRKTKIAQRWVCYFKNPYAHAHIDPQVKAAFDATDIDPKWGDMRAIWRRMHCATLNPYGSEDCPYDEVWCAVAFRDAVQETLQARPRRFGALFRYVARRTGAERADAAQGSRDRRGRSGGQVQGHHPALGQPAALVRRGHGGSARGDGDVQGGTGTSLRGSDRGPHRLGTLFGSLDIGSRPQGEGRDDGEESTE